MRLLLQLGACAALLGSFPPGAAFPSQEPVPAQEPAADKAQDLADELETLSAEWDEAFEKHAQAVSEKKQAANEELRPEDLLGGPEKEYAPRFRALADRAKGSETGASALIKLIDVQKHDGEGKLVDELLRDHPSAGPLAELPDALSHVAWFQGGKASELALRKLSKGAQDKDVRLAALSNLAMLLSEPEIRKGAKPAEQNTPERSAEAQRVFKEIVEKHPDSEQAGQARDQLYILEHLSVGKSAPDFSATDENGKAWKLSDYRGKVVVVDFWGFW